MLYRILAVILLGAGIVSGSFYTGVQHERNRAKVKGFEVFAGQVDRALKLADDFQKIATDFVNKKTEVEVVTRTVVRKQVEYVKANDVPDVTVPAYILGMRACQINRIRKAAHYPVLGGSDESLCASGVAEHGQGTDADSRR